MVSSDPARCLNATYYTDCEVFAREREHLFFKTWQFACHSKEIPNVGDFLTVQIFDQSIIVVRSDDNELAAYYNVCPHRGHQLVQDEGNKRQFVCPYHQWTYNLNGQLRGARGFDRKDEICLSKVCVETLAGFVFINLDPDAEPLSEFAKGLEQQITTKIPDVLTYTPVKPDTAGFGNTYHCKSNWKVMLDNFLECYHCEGAHPTFNDMMDISANKFELHGNFTYQTTPTALKAENAAFPLNLEHDATTGNFWFLFPNTTLGQFPGVPGFYVSRFDPIDPDNTNRITTTLMINPLPDPDAERRDKLRADWNVDVVANEDKALCEAVQRGMNQRGFTAGWYVTQPDKHNISEHAQRHFHELYLNALK